jgi:hypothetical protein
LRCGEVLGPRIFVEFTFFVSRPVVVAKAGELDMPVIGHVGPDVGPSR